ncbi:MAG TPA: FkbM family methyltransferase [Chitinophagaceae bacterium]
MKKSISRGMHRLNLLLNRQIFKATIDKLSPNIFCCEKKLFGNKGDGGYVLPVRFLDPDKYVVLSFGVNDDISFEEAVLASKPGMGIYCFDPTVPGLPHENRDIRFYPIGLAGKTNRNRKLLELKDAMKYAGLDPAVHQVLKIDIEGWEWSFLKTFDPAAYNADVLAIEFHFNLFKDWQTFLVFPYVFRRRYKLLSQLLNHYYIFHVHANNLSYTRVGEYMFPNLLEMTLIKKNVFEERILEDVKKYNTPNIPGSADHQYPFRAHGS